MFLSNEDDVGQMMVMGCGVTGVSCVVPGSLSSEAGGPRWKGQGRSSGDESCIPPLEPILLVMHQVHSVV